MQMPEPVTETNLEGLRLVSRGKVRDMYEVPGAADRLLIVTTDRISAYDSVLGSAIPWKGMVLTHLTRFWLDYLSELTAHHLISTEMEQILAACPQQAREPLQAGADLLRGRTMLVRRADVLPVECVVRGYLAGSGWRSYRDGGAVCGVELPAGLVEGQKLPEPIFTPATKAVSGHDENITFERMEELIGGELAREVRGRSLQIYRRAADYAAERGILISDTKFEWGLDPGTEGDGLTLVDEVLTPDSSRFWPAETYEPGGPQLSYDKQYVRDWLDESGWDHQPPAPALPREVVARTAEKYLEACRLLTGSTPAD